MKKILWLASWYPNKNSPFEGDFIQRHAKALALLNPVTVIYIAQGGIEQPEKKEVYIEHTTNGLTEIIYHFTFSKTGWSLLDKIRYNIIYRRKAKQLLKNYFAIHGKPDIVHVHIPLKAGLLALWVKKKWGINYFVSDHSSHYVPHSFDAFDKRPWLHRLMTGRVFTHARKVTTVSQDVQKKINTLFAVKDYTVIPNVVDTSVFNLDTVAAVYNRPFTFIHVSSLVSPHKNAKQIINSFARLVIKGYDCKLVLVGPFNQDLLETAEQLNLSNCISFTGEIGYNAVAQTMKEADAFVLFSDFENLPCVILEALCCGLPVISSDVGGIREVVTAENGILVNNITEDALYTAMQQLYTQYAVYNRPAIALNAYNTFNYKKIAADFLSFYNG